MTNVDNSASEGNSGDLITAAAQGQLRSFVERLERLMLVNDTMPSSPP